MSITLGIKHDNDNCSHFQGLPSPLVRSPLDAQTQQQQPYQQQQQLCQQHSLALPGGNPYLSQPTTIALPGPLSSLSSSFTQPQTQNLHHHLPFPMPLQDHCSLQPSIPFMHPSPSSDSISWWSRPSWQMSSSIHQFSWSYIGVRGSVTHLDTSLHSVCSTSVSTTSLFCVYVRMSHSAPLQQL